MRKRIGVLYHTRTHLMKQAMEIHIHTSFSRTNECMNDSTSSANKGVSSLAFAMKHLSTCRSTCTSVSSLFVCVRVC